MEACTYMRPSMLIYGGYLGVTRVHTSFGISRGGHTPLMRPNGGYLWIPSIVTIMRIIRNYAKNGRG